MKTIFKHFIVAILTLLPIFVFGQKYSGMVINKTTGKVVEYTNIGIVGKNMGTVSDDKGKFELTIDSQFDNDTIKFSNLGYISYSIKVSDFKKLKSLNINLEEKPYQIKEVTINPITFKHKTLGISTTSKVIQAGFDENKLGYECGILMKVKKSAKLEKVNINIATCTYDTIFYRLNIYKVTDKKEFENILQKPIYVNIPKDKIKGKLEIDLIPYNLIVDGDFLVTLEHVKNLGKGGLYFCVGLAGKTYIRRTSQGDWDTSPIGISISVDAMVEK